jgi:predicted transposase/invertase (TIGR01784 family)
MRYERSLKIYRDNLAAMEYREQIGLERGEKRKQTEIARNMRAKGSPIDFIVEVTGLSAKEVEKL